MTAEILSVGTELLLGDIINTNAAYIAKELATMGIDLYHQTVVGDNPERLKKALHDAFDRADLVITTGGLGPTFDDVTKETVAAYFGAKMVRNEEAMERIAGYYAKRGIELTPNTRKQAEVPEGCTVFQSPRWKGRCSAAARWCRSAGSASPAKSDSAVRRPRSPGCCWSGRRTGRCPRDRAPAGSSLPAN